ncbi:MAG: hypothetical protein KatS3mg068_1830 [Candidatus Sericytochromatia bacterium]|nr:MAG: hypothetical protein KatS3mg068_1830 [Candidatus Sericytochromatia bacterium]
MYNFSELLNNKNKKDLFYKSVSNVNTDDPCLIIYTSGGSTGISKGALFTHRNLLFYQKSLNYLLNITENDNILSYFNWYQSFGIAEKFLSLYSGACLIIDRTPGIHLETLCNDIKQCKPTIYFGSSKVFNQLVIEMENNIELKTTILHKDLNFCFSSSYLPKKSY